MKAWIDTATSSPLRTDTGEAAPEFTSFGLTQHRTPEIGMKKTDKRMVS